MGMMVSLVIQFLDFFFAKTQSYHPLFSFPTCLFLLSILPQKTHLVPLLSIVVRQQHASHCTLDFPKKVGHQMSCALELLWWHHQATSFSVESCGARPKQSKVCIQTFLL